jgi:hypothetical protein
MEIYKIMASVVEEYLQKYPEVAKYIADNLDVIKSEINYNKKSR